MAAAHGKEVLLVDINGGADEGRAGAGSCNKGIEDGPPSRSRRRRRLIGTGNEPGLRSPLADSVMLAAYAELERRGHRALWGVFGYGSDGELTWMRWSWR